MVNSNSTPAPAEKPEPTTYLVELRPGPHDPVPLVTLRKALKCLLRGFGLKCLSVSEKRPQAAEPGDGGAGFRGGTEKRVLSERGCAVALIPRGRALPEIARFCPLLVKRECPATASD